MLPLLIFTLLVGIPTSRQEMKLVYDATSTQRLTLSTTAQRIEIGDSAITCLETDQFRRGAWVFCDGANLKRLKSHPRLKLKTVNTHMLDNVKALQRNDTNWLVLSRSENCIRQVSFHTKSYTEIAGCRGWGNRDGIGIDAQFDLLVDMVFNVFDHDIVYILTSTKLRILSLISQAVSTPFLFQFQLRLLYGFTRMMWIGQNLTFLSPSKYFRIKFANDSKTEELWDSQANPIIWQPVTDYQGEGTPYNLAYYVSDVTPTGKPGVFLAGFVGGGFKIIDFNQKRSSPLQYNNSCLGQDSTALAFDEGMRSMATSYSKYICTMKVEWTESSGTTPTPEETEPAETTAIEVLTTATTAITTTATVDSTKATTKATIAATPKATSGATRKLATTTESIARTTRSMQTQKQDQNSISAMSPSFSFTEKKISPTTGNGKPKLFTSSDSPNVQTDYQIYFIVVSIALALVLTMVIVALLMMLIRKNAKKRRIRPHRQMIRAKVNVIQEVRNAEQESAYQEIKNSNHYSTYRDIDSQQMSEIKSIPATKPSLPPRPKTQIK